MRATKVNAGLAESNGRLLLGIWHDSLHVTCGLTACTPGSAPGPTLGNEYGKTLPFFILQHFNWQAFQKSGSSSMSSVLQQGRWQDHRKDIQHVKRTYATDLQRFCSGKKRRNRVKPANRHSVIKRNIGRKVGISRIIYLFTYLLTKNDVSVMWVEK